MITNRLKGKELFNEIYSDYLTTIKKDLKKRRDLERKPYVKANKPIDTYIEYTILTPKYNNWFVRSGIVGSSTKPKAINHFHVITNSGFNGSKLYIVYRGMKSTEKGYIVTVTSHVITRMRERNREYKNLTVNELLLKLFKENEEGLYYDYCWKTKDEIILPSNSQEALLLENNIKLKNTDTDDSIQVVLKTSAGIFLGYSSTDRSEVRLITYISDLGELEDLVKNFLEPAWICYNYQMFDEDFVKETNRNLLLYMKGKADRNVYRLGE